MNIATIKNPVDALIQEAKKYLGVVEEPKLSNRSIEIDYWLDELKVPLGLPWCAAYVTQVGRQALGHAWPVLPSASVQNIANWGRNFTFDKPEKGDLFILFFPSLKRFAHIGIVYEVLTDGSFKTIEGNTNPGGSRDGYGVFERVRKPDGQTKFIRWINALPQ